MMSPEARLALHRGWMKAIRDNATKELDEWETGFVANIEVVLRKGFQITDKQAARLETIYSEKTA